MTDLAAAGYERFARAALARYRLESATVTLLSVSENRTFLVEAGDRRVVLRVHRPDYHSLAAVESGLTGWTVSDAIHPSRLRRSSALRTVAGSSRSDSETMCDWWICSPSYRDELQRGCLGCQLQ